MATRLFAIARTFALASLVGLSAQGTAQRGRSGGAQARSTTAHHRSGTTHRSTTHTASRNTNVNRNANVNVNRNVNVDVNHRGYGYHPVARGAVAGATAAAVMGSYYATLPTGCATVTQMGVVYHHCGSTWYKTVGTQYLVVPQP
jgi:hypothetical protein